MTNARLTGWHAYFLSLLILPPLGLSGTKGSAADPPDPPVLTDPTTIEQTGTHVFAVGFSRDGTRLALAAGRESLQVFDVATRKRVLRVGDLNDNFDDSIREFALAPDGKTLAL